MSQIDREQAFLALLQDTLKQARRGGGRISRQEITEIFGEYAPREEQLGQVEDYLRAHKIAVEGEAGSGDALPEDEEAFLTSYLEMLREIPRVSDNVLEALKISAMAGETSARRELAEQMLGIVVDIAKLYVGQGVSIEDLIGAGNEALMLGTAMLGHLESPAEVEGELGRRIMDAMEDLIASMLDEKALGREMEDLANLVADEARKLAQVMGRKVTAQELAAEGKVTLEQIREAERLTGGKIKDLEG